MKRTTISLAHMAMASPGFVAACIAADRHNQARREPNPLAAPVQAPTEQAKPEQLGKATPWLA